MDPWKVLIADNSSEFREALSAALTPGFQVISCLRGDEAPALLESEKPDLLILDLNLPGRDGISILEHLEFRPPVLVVTDLINPYVYGCLVRLGVEYAIRKPCSIQSVADRAFDLVRQQQESVVTECLRETLTRMGLPNGRQGFQHLLTGIPLLSQQRDQRLSKELYEAIALLDRSTPAAVEKSIREVIHHGWHFGDRREWNRWFPGLSQCPKNKEFLFRMADLLAARRLCG